jgi:hypothetical protein
MNEKMAFLAMPIYCLLAGLLIWPGAVATGRAQEGPYFVTYDSHLEEPGNLELEFEPTAGKPRGGNSFLSYLTEFEYGTSAWWTTELYVEGQSTRNDSTLFTGFRVENRFQVLAGQHWVNPVLYVEYEDISGADKALKEVVGFDSQDDGAASNGVARREIQREVETKLILSSDYKGWNMAENFIAEKNLAHAPWEFGYAWGLNRPLRLAASPSSCNICGENWRAGVEIYGGLGTVDQFTLRDTSQYIAPVLAWSLPSGTTLRISPTFGLTDNAYRFLLRLGVTYEFPGLGQRVKQFFHGAGR